MRVRIIGYGAAIQSVYVPDAQGRFADVTTGYDTRDAYVAQPHYFGSTIGRVANGIADARFTLDGKEYLVPANDGGNSLHGGELGFNKVNWTVTSCDEEAMSVTLSHFSPDGDQGYPGSLYVTATYQLHADNALSVRYQATTDAPTIVNLFNQPGLQFYSGNFFDGSTIGKAGKSYYRGDAIALEPQMFPDAPNQASFASVALHPYMMYENMIIWQFGATAPNADEHLPQ
jgi:aldose 1-epimerase